MVNILRLDDGKLVWDRPVEDYEWDVIINGQQRTLTVDCFLSEDQASKPMRVYATIHGHMFASTKERLIRENGRYLKNPNRWKISARDLHPERVGLTKFVGAPALSVVKWWRQPIDPRWQWIMKTIKHGFPLKKNGLNKVSLRVNSELPIDILMKWPGIYTLTHVHGTDFMETRVTIRPEFIEWLRNGTRGVIFPFSDFKSTFELEDDEWVYMTDFHPALDIDSPDD